MTNLRNHDDSTMSIRLMCAVVFLVFTFLWLYFFQADVIAVAQHVLSGGQTHYHRLAGALLMTSGLWLLQLFVYRITGLRGAYHALTYFPSMVLLGLICNIDSSTGAYAPLGIWLWLLILLSLVWLAAVWVGRQLGTAVADKPVLFSHCSWVNLLLLVLMTLVTVSLANTNAVFHYRAHAETSFECADFPEALAVGQRSLETDTSLTMLRIYALARTGQLGERLFQYPVAMTSADMLPLGGRAKTLMYPADSIYRSLGAIPKGRMTVSTYLEQLETTGKATAAVADYRLCGWLIDRNLDAFAQNLPRYYEINDSLPRHYREALVLYAHLRSNPVIVYHHATTDVDYEDLQELERKYARESERKVRVEEKYAGSYWYYYEYQL